MRLYGHSNMYCRRFRRGIEQRDTVSGCLTNQNLARVFTFGLSAVLEV
jgi:hypothetical protein